MFSFAVKYRTDPTACLTIIWINDVVDDDDDVSTSKKLLHMQHTRTMLIWCDQNKPTLKDRV